MNHHLKHAITNRLTIAEIPLLCERMRLTIRAFPIGSRNDLSHVSNSGVRIKVIIIHIVSIWILNVKPRINIHLTSELMARRRRRHE
jgi:hypothetical protein